MRRPALLLAIIVICAFTLRVPGLFTDFWLDEIWSLNIARAVQSPADVLFSEAARIDNNHPLHTWYLCAVGDVRQWWIYRLPALVCGIGSVIVAAHALARRGAIESITAAVVIAFSFPLVFYSSEARGYGPAVFFAVLGYGAMMRYVDRAAWSSALVYNIACVLGFLSHLTFVHFFLASMYWTVLRMRRTHLPVPQQVGWWMKLNGVPTLFVIALFRVFVRDMTIGGASPTDPLHVIVRTLALAMGGLDFGIGAMLCATITVALFSASLVRLIRQRDDRWFFYLLAVVVAPGFLLFYNLVLSAKPQPLMPRYFLVATAMALIGIAHLASSVNPRVVASALLVICVANTIRTMQFWQSGRDGATAAIERVLAETPTSNVTVKTESVFRAGPVIDFYQSRIVPPDRRIELRDLALPAQWKLTMSSSSELSGFVWQLERIDE